MANDVEMYTQTRNETTMTKEVWTRDQLREGSTIQCGGVYCKVRCLTHNSCQHITLECSADRCIVEGRDLRSAFQMTIDATQSRELYVYQNSTESWVFELATILCPTNQCGSEQCGQLCEIEGNGDYALALAVIHAESVAHLKVTVGGEQGFYKGQAFTSLISIHREIAEFIIPDINVLNGSMIQGIRFSQSKSEAEEHVSEAVDGLTNLALALPIFGGSVAFIGIVLLLFYLWKQRRGGRQSQGDKDGAEVEQAELKDADNENIAEYGQANRV